MQSRRGCCCNAVGISLNHPIAQSAFASILTKFVGFSHLAPFTFAVVGVIDVVALPCHIFVVVGRTLSLRGCLWLRILPPLTRATTRRLEVSCNIFLRYFEAFMVFSVLLIYCWSFVRNECMLLYTSPYVLIRWLLLPRELFVILACFYGLTIYKLCRTSKCLLIRYLRTKR